MISPASPGVCVLAAFSRTSLRRPVMYTLAPGRFLVECRALGE